MVVYWYTDTVVVYWYTDTVVVLCWYNYSNMYQQSQLPAMHFLASDEA